MRQGFVLGKWSFDWSGGGSTCLTRGGCMASGENVGYPRRYEVRSERGSIASVCFACRIPAIFQFIIYSDHCNCPI